MNRPEVPLQYFTRPEDWTANSARRIFPPTEGNAMYRAVEGMNRLMNITWPYYVFAEEVERKKTALFILANEFITNALEEHPDTTLDFGLKRHEAILRNIKLDIRKASQNTVHLYDTMIPDTEEETRQAILTAEKESKERHAAEDEATKIIWQKTDKTKSHIRLQGMYRRNPDHLSQPLQTLLRTAQDFLVMETFADRKGFGDTPNIWSTLIDMYILGMRSYYIDPETSGFTISMLVVNNGQAEEQSFTVPKLQ